MHLVLTLTSGEGYSSPDILLVEDKISAENHFHQKVGETLLISDTTHLTQRGNDGDKRYAIFEEEDECDHSVLWFDEVKPNQIYHIDTNFVNNVTVYELCDLTDIIKELGVDPDEKNFEVKSQSYALKEVHLNISVQCKKTGTYHIFLNIL